MNVLHGGGGMFGEEMVSWPCVVKVNPRPGNILANIPKCGLEFLVGLAQHVTPRQNSRRMEAVANSARQLCLGAPSTSCDITTRPATNLRWGGGVDEERASNWLTDQAATNVAS